MSDETHEQFVGEPRRSQVTDARGQAVSKEPYRQPTKPAASTGPLLDEDDFGTDVLAVRALTDDVRELSIQISGQPLTFHEHFTGREHRLCYPTLDFCVQQGDDGWLPFAGEERIVHLPPFAYRFVVGEQAHPANSIIFLDVANNAVTYKIPEVRYRDSYWGLNRQASAYEFISWLNYNPLPMIALANFYEGAIAGDAIAEPTLAHLLGQAVVSFIPVVGQLADLRDTIVSLVKIWQSGGKEGKADLAFNLVGWIPAAELPGLLPKIAHKFRAGDIFTGVAKHSDDTWGLVVRRGDEVVQLTEKTEHTVVKGVSELMLKTEKKIERQVFCGLS